MTIVLIIWLYGDREEASKVEVFSEGDGQDRPLISSALFRCRRALIRQCQTRRGLRTTFGPTHGMFFSRAPFIGGGGKKCIASLSIYTVLTVAALNPSRPAPPSRAGPVVQERAPDSTIQLLKKATPVSFQPF